MPRPPRIQYEHAYYHVMNQGLSGVVLIPLQSNYRVFKTRNS